LVERRILPLKDTKKHEKEEEEESTNYTNIYEFLALHPFPIPYSLFPTPYSADYFSKPSH